MNNFENALPIDGMLDVVAHRHEDGLIVIDDVPTNAGVPRQAAGRFWLSGKLGVIGLAIMFGFVGLSRVKKTGRKGRGLAIAGVVLGFVWLVVSIVCGVWFANRVSDNVDRLAAGPHVPGQCFDLADGATLQATPTAHLSRAATPADVTTSSVVNPNAGRRW